LIAAAGSAQWCALNVESAKSNVPAGNGNDSAGTGGVNVDWLQGGVAGDAGSVACRTLAASLSNETARRAR